MSGFASLALANNIKKIPAGFAGSNGPPPSVITFVTQSATATTTASVNVTAAAGAFVVLTAGAEQLNLVQPAITTVTGLGLTWTRRTFYQNQLGTKGGQANPAGQRLEVWYAVNNTASPITNTVTVNYDVTFDDQAMTVVTYSGVNTSFPWDSSGPYSTALVGPDPSVTISSIPANSLALLASFASVGSIFATPAGWTENGRVQNSNGTNWAFTTTWSKSFTSSQSSLLVTATGGGGQLNTTYPLIADVLNGP